MKYSIKTENLNKMYGKFEAVSNLNLNIEDKTIFGFLGHNGAGKTTTIKMLTCLIAPTSGSAEVAGYNILESPNQIREKIGVVPQHVSLYGDLTIKENIEFCGDFYGIPKNKLSVIMDDLMERLDIKYAENRQVKNLSGGMKQKASVVASLIHRPEIIFLDEPTTGLDPITKQVLWELIEELNSDGCTIVLCSHDMYEVEKLSDKVGILNAGKLVRYNTPQGLKDDIRDKIDNEREITFLVSNINLDFIKKLEKTPQVKNVQYNQDGRVYVKTTKDDKVLDDIIKLLDKSDINLLSFSTKDPDLEMVLLDAMGDK